MTQDQAIISAQAEQDRRILQVSDAISFLSKEDFDKMADAITDLDLERLRSLDDRLLQGARAMAAIGLFEAMKCTIDRQRRGGE